MARRCVPVVLGLAGASLALAGCPSGASVRGIEIVGTAHPTSGTQVSGGKLDPSCRGRKVEAWTSPRFCVTEFARDLSRPRHLVVAPNGDLLVATRRGIVVLWDESGDGESDAHERGLLGGPDVSQQGVALTPDARWLYIADSRAVRRMPFRPGMRSSEEPFETVIPDVPLTIDHPYRTITFDRQGRLYLAVGASDNLTPGGGAVIMRYAVPDAIPTGGVPFAGGERLAVGLRNAEALAWDGDGRLWAFVNGRDYLRPPGTDETFYLDHPGDGVYRLDDQPGTFYGFPNCWVLGPVPWGSRRDPTSQWADPDASEGHDDAWCQGPANVHPAAGALPAHTAPLGAAFYTGGLFPPKYRNSFFVTSHGSWNRHGEQRGRTILDVRVEGGRVAGIETIAGERASDGNLLEGRWSERPVGIAQGLDGALYVASDETGHVLRVGYAHE